MSWKTLQIYLGIAVFVIVAVQNGISIKCWECNSEYDSRCGDPFRKNTFEITDCSQKLLPHYPSSPAIVCRKITQKIKGTQRFIRTCGYLERTKTTQDCFRRAGTFDVQIEYCQCDKDGCNGSGNIRGHVVLTTVIMAVLAYKYFKYDSNV